MLKRHGILYDKQYKRKKIHLLIGITKDEEIDDISKLISY